MINEDKHALLSASGSPRWTKCPASTAMEYGLEEDASEYAEEGTRAHKLAHDIFIAIDKSEPKDFFNLLSNYNDKQIAEAAKDYVGYVCSLIKEQQVEIVGLVEQKVDFSNVVINGYGTADYISYDLVSEHLDVIDFKYGFNKVEATENTQMLLYAIGAANLFENIKTVTLHIVQPRINHFDTWTISYDELLERKNFFQIKTIRALTLVDEFVPSLAACKYCKAKTICPGLKAFIDNITIELKQKMDQDQLFINTQDNKVILSSDFLKKMLDNSQLIKDYLQTLETLSTNRILTGEEIEGYKVVNSNTCRKLVPDAEDKLLAIYGNNIYKKSIKGIGELEKIVGKRALDSFTYKAPGRPTIVKSNDRRTSLNEETVNFENIN